MAENKWANGVITLLMGVITPLTLDRRGPPCKYTWKPKSRDPKIQPTASSTACQGSMLTNAFRVKKAEVFSVQIRALLEDTEKKLRTHPR